MIRIDWAYTPSVARTNCIHNRPARIRAFAVYMLSYEHKLHYR